MPSMVSMPIKSRQSSQEFCHAVPSFLWIVGRFYHFLLAVNVAIEDLNTLMPGSRHFAIGSVCFRFEVHVKIDKTKKAKLWLAREIERRKSEVMEGLWKGEVEKNDADLVFERYQNRKSCESSLFLFFSTMCMITNVWATISQNCTVLCTPDLYINSYSLLLVIEESYCTPKNRCWTHDEYKISESISFLQSTSTLAFSVLTGHVTYYKIAYSEIFPWKNW